MQNIVHAIETETGEVFSSAADAQNAGYVQCVDCGDWILKEDATETADGPVCDSCLTNDYVICDVCGDYVQDNDVQDVRFYSSTYAFTTQNVCSTCVENIDTIRECADCGTLFDASEAYADSDGEISTYEDGYRAVCGECLFDHYVECESCGTWVRIENARERGCDYYCPDCAGSDDLEEYGRTDKRTCNLRFFKTHADPDGYKLFLGVELETENDDNDDAATAIKNAVNRACGDRDAVVCKRDGSLDCGGCEVVTMPMSLRYHTETTLWDAVTTNADYVSERTGMHVHISRDFFACDAELTTFCRILCRFVSHFRTIGERSDGCYYGRWPSAHKMGIDLQNDNYIAKRNKTMAFLQEADRYTAINLKPRDTIELRFFESTLDPDTIRGRLELVAGAALVAHELGGGYFGTVVEEWSWDDAKTMILTTLWAHGYSTKQAVNLLKRLGE